MLLCAKHYLQLYTICGRDLYVMGFTSGHTDAGSDDSPSIKLDLINHDDAEFIFPDNDGDDMLENKGDLWKIPISHFGLNEECLMKGDISKVTLINGGSDGWDIASIVTMLCSGDNCDLLTVNLGVDRWLDGDDEYIYREFTLHLI